MAKQYKKLLCYIHLIMLSLFAKTMTTVPIPINRAYVIFSKGSPIVEIQKSFLPDLGVKILWNILKFLIHLAVLPTHKHIFTYFKRKIVRCAKKKMLVFKKDFTCFHLRKTYPSGDLPGGDTGAILETYAKIKIKFKPTK
jgi:hypothetical protein